MVGDQRWFNNGAIRNTTVVRQSTNIVTFLVLQLIVATRRFWLANQMCPLLLGFNRLRSSTRQVTLRNQTASGCVGWAGWRGRYADVEGLMMFGLNLVIIALAAVLKHTMAYNAIPTRCSVNAYHQAICNRGGAHRVERGPLLKKLCEGLEFDKLQPLSACCVVVEETVGGHVCINR